MARRGIRPALGPAKWLQRTSGAKTCAHSENMQMRNNDRRECLFPPLEELQSCRKPIGVHSKLKQAVRGYPPDLDTSVKGVDAEAKKLRFLRKIPRPDAGHDRLGNAVGAG